MGVFKERHIEQQEKQREELRNLYCSLYLPHFEKELGPLKGHGRNAVRLQDLCGLLRWAEN